MNVTGIVNNKTETHAPSGNATSNASPTGRLAVMLAEVLLLILLAYLMVTMVYQMITPRPDFLSALQSKAQIYQPVAERAYYNTVISFDPFYREAAIGSQSQAAPESNLKLTITGLRTDGVGGGAAIIDAQDGGQKLVSVGAEISPGITLSKVYRDRIEINRRGARETVYMVKPGAAAQVLSTRVDTVVPTSSAGSSARGNISDIIAELRLEPIRRNGRIAGFRITEEMPPALLEAMGLETGDVIVAVAGSRLSSFERLKELEEELSGATTIEIEIERRGQQLLLTF